MEGGNPTSPAPSMEAEGAADPQPSAHTSRAHLVPQHWESSSRPGWVPLGTENPGVPGTKGDRGESQCGLSSSSGTRGGEMDHRNVTWDHGHQRQNLTKGGQGPLLEGQERPKHTWTALRVRNPSRSPYRGTREKGKCFWRQNSPNAKSHPRASPSPAARPGRRRRCAVVSGQWSAPRTPT